MIFTLFNIFLKKEGQQIQKNPSKQSGWQKSEFSETFCSKMDKMAVRWCFLNIGYFTGAAAAPPFPPSLFSPALKSVKWVTLLRAIHGTDILAIYSTPLTHLEPNT